MQNQAPPNFLCPQAHSPQVNQMQIYDSIYDRAESALDQELAWDEEVIRMRERGVPLRIIKKIGQERAEELKNKTETLRRQQEEEERQSKKVGFYPDLTPTENSLKRLKTKGKERIPMPIIIEKFANEGTAFYQHKKRNFINKIQSMEKNLSMNRNIINQRTLGTNPRASRAYSMDPNSPTMSIKTLEQLQAKSQAVRAFRKKETLRKRREEKSKISSIHQSEEGEEEDDYDNSIQNDNHCSFQNQPKTSKSVYSKFQGRKFEDYDRNIMRYKFLYNKLVHMSNDESEARSLILSRNNLMSQGTYKNSVGRVSFYGKKPQGLVESLPKVNDSLNSDLIKSQSRQRCTPLSSIKFHHQPTGSSVKPQRRKALKSQHYPMGVQGNIKAIVDKCVEDHENTKVSLVRYEGDLQKVQKKINKFDNVLNILQNIETDNTNIIENLYYYQVNDIKEGIEEAEQVRIEHRIGMLDPTRDVTKIQQRMRFKTRKQIQERRMKALNGR